ncbi:MAG: AmmeMemoRadiSam system protein A [Candidatus Acidiferrales bacterium]|jgi:AmmeMemoRadiSam system protein A
MSSVDNRERKLLLEVARLAVTAAVERRESLLALPQDADAALVSFGGAFVTLHRGRRLRGCIGQIASSESLVEVVAYCAKAAALEDPRFRPVQPEELSEIEIELSILSRPAEIPPERIEAGRHGLMVSQGWRRGVLLPQVAAEFQWTAERLLEETCIKAGFERDAWKDAETKIQAFTAEVFRESDFRAEARASSGPAQPGYSTST